MGYATVEDYEARYGTLGESEAARVQVLLDDASLKVDALVERYQIDAQEKAPVLEAMTCDYVHYQTQFAVGSNVSAVTHQAGAFLETYSMRSELGFDKWVRRYYGDTLGLAPLATTLKVAIHDVNGQVAGDLNAW